MLQFDDLRNQNTGDVVDRDYAALITSVSPYEGSQRSERGEA